MFIKHPDFLEWLDLLITVTLNPDRTNVREISKNQFNGILSQIENNEAHVVLQFDNWIFSLTTDDEIRLLVRQYHSSLIVLLDCLLESQRKVGRLPDYASNVYSKMIDYLNKVFSFIEVRFPNYLSLEERVPVTYLEIAKQEFRSLLRKRRNKKDDEYTRLVISRLEHFARANSYPYKLTFRVVLYNKELVKGLEEIEASNVKYDDFSATERMLIYLNFNSKKFIDLLTGRLAKEINTHENPVERMDKLLYYYKAFKQLHWKPGVKLNPKFHDLDLVISNWFVQEILYLERKLRLFVKPLQGNAETKSKNKTEKIQKVLCVLSTDQMALVLRAADDLRIIQAKSLNEVFRTITPYLSTPYKEDISHGSMRSKAYNPEERDRQIAIETLERIIEKIKEY
ncbi:hypothetical protein [Sphingobacterium mizutaii]|uniref:hypothetical protein n=1 Tax=Sphingobacterium mizutaii TaxID=1010 RepID=UPI001625B6A7|nr:hypothetical protein [Sphingobacterium mizutaii]